MDQQIKTIARLCLLICLVWLTTTAPVYARGGCFAGDTHILTEDGDRAIEQLRAGDHVLGLNLSSQQLETEEISEVQVVEASDYYVINDSITVTGSHPFYVQEESGLRLMTVKNLSVGDQLVGENGLSPVVRRIQRYDKPITVYNLVSVTPHHNFFAEGVLVHNKGGGGGGGFSGGGIYGGSGYRGTPINEKTIPGYLTAAIIFVVSLLPFAFWREIYNSIRFFGKDFTDDDDLIAFTQQINPNFSNRYSAGYRKDNEAWQEHPLSKELDTAAYREKIGKVGLTNQVSQIFVRYQNDWMKKDFDAMADYTVTSFQQKQQATFKAEFWNNFDIVYSPEIKHLTAISVQQKESSDFVITVQLIATAVNFELSSRGKVRSGEPFRRTFTEYWDVTVDDHKKCRLLDIRDS